VLTDQSASLIHSPLTMLLLLLLMHAVMNLMMLAAAITHIPPATVSACSPSVTESVYQVY